MAWNEVVMERSDRIPRSQLPGLEKTKMVMYSITSKLNSDFSTIGKATADKITAKLVGKNSRFHLNMKN